MEAGPSGRKVGGLLGQATPQGALPLGQKKRGQGLILKRGDSAGEFQGINPDRIAQVNSTLGSGDQVITICKEAAKGKFTIEKSRTYLGNLKCICASGSSISVFNVSVTIV